MATQTKREKLTAELAALEEELIKYADVRSESQVWHKRARVDAIKKELAEMGPESKADKFKSATQAIKDMDVRADESELQHKFLRQYGGGRSA